jgi:hypothetical protein
MGSAGAIGGHPLHNDRSVFRPEPPSALPREPLGRDDVDGSHGSTVMSYRNLLGAIALASLSVWTASAQIVDYSKYPNLKGQWERRAVPGLPGQPSFDQTKGWGPYQQAPLTPEYRKIMEDSMADQAAGGHGNTADHVRMMIAFRPLEFVIMPDVTYILIADFDPLRRVFTDGRDWPKDIEPTFAGYSIGKWIDEDGDGKYDVLEVETRGFKGSRCALSSATSSGSRGRQLMGWMAP